MFSYKTTFHISCFLLIVKFGLVKTLMFLFFRRKNGLKINVLCAFTACDTCALDFLHCWAYDALSCSILICWKSILREKLNIKNPIFISIYFNKMCSSPLELTCLWIPSQTCFFNFFIKFPLFYVFLFYLTVLYIISWEVFCIFFKVLWIMV